MSEEQYLPIKESLGYKNVKQALWNVFSVDLDSLSVTHGEFEDFGFVLEYKHIKIDMGISSSGKNIQLNIGEGGTFDISLPNPKYPENPFLSKRFFYNFIEDSIIRDDVQYVLGRDEESIEYAMRVLKDYLDSDKAKVLLKND